MSNGKAQGTAVPLLVGAHRSAAEMVQCGTNHYNALSGSSEWTDAALHGPAADWKQSTDDLAANHQKLEDLRKQIAVVLGQEVVLMRKWSSTAHACQGAVGTHCAGNADKVKACGFANVKRSARPPASTPSNLKAKNTKQEGQVGVEWDSDGYRHDYQVQWATNPADTATYSALNLVSQRKFVLSGQTYGAMLHFRVRALDAKLQNGTTDWTPWVAVLVT